MYVSIFYKSEQLWFSALSAVRLKAPDLQAYNYSFSKGITQLYQGMAVST